MDTVNSSVCHLKDMTLYNEQPSACREARRASQRGAGMIMYVATLLLLGDCCVWTRTSDVIWLSGAVPRVQALLKCVWLPSENFCSQTRRECETGVIMGSPLLHHQGYVPRPRHEYCGNRASGFEEASAQPEEPLSSDAVVLQPLLSISGCESRGMVTAAAVAHPHTSNCSVESAAGALGTSKPLPIFSQLPGLEACAPLNRVTQRGLPFPPERVFRRRRPSPRVYHGKVNLIQARMLEKASDGQKSDPLMSDLKVSMDELAHKQTVRA
ncbi:hypothetical protein NDU88_005949 [Pleurodeles waltl]|uniref:Uncharacterized protein n=1 Tax=Pleurodeles waltl TaxID=8319 RepID=A0AAV7PQ02_PLEWA|nr:hypothetical protein NDU88_005949 [Pleurodeles waltl]